MILALRTDSPTSELYLLESDGSELTQDIWEAGNNLSDELLSHVQALLKSQGADWQAVSGIIAYQGPGSFTGLRIGLTVANTLAYAQGVSIVGSKGETWMEDGLAELGNQPVGAQVMPEYGRQANITKPRK